MATLFLYNKLLMCWLRSFKNSIQVGSNRSLVGFAHMSVLVSGYKFPCQGTAVRAPTPAVFQTTLRPRRFFTPTPAKSLPLLPPPLTETRQYTSMFGPQYGWAVCCVVSACDQSTLATGAEGLWWPMMVNHHSYLFTSFFNRWHPSGGSWRCTTTCSDAICNIHPT